MLNESLEARKACSKLAYLVSSNSDIAKKVSHLVLADLKEDLMFAKTHKPGFYANGNDEYMMIRGYEVDDSCDLARSGPNGERCGVFAHVTTISNESKKLFDGRIDRVSTIQVCSVPVIYLWKKFYGCKKKNTFHKSTEEIFNVALKKGIEDVHKKFTDDYPVDQYYNYITNFTKFYEDLYSKL